tara:strand:+ start:6426 stop:7436 length:1011 start_codon:yes stop_codon:yes gene_type:complete
MFKKRKEGFANSCSNDDSGIFEYNDESTYKENLDRYRSTLTENERKKFDKNTQKTYKKTFWLCVIYALIALVILLVGIFSQWGNNVFFTELFAFVITYIIGTIIIISLLTWSIYSFDFPEIKKELNSDANYCPDYWKNEYGNTDGLKRGEKYLFGEIEENQFNIKCNIDNNTIYTPDDIQHPQQTEIKDHTDDNGLTSSVVRNLRSLHNLNTDETINKSEFLNGIGLNEDEYKKFRKIMARTAGYNLVSDKEGEQDNFQMELNNENALMYDGTSHYSNSGANSANLVPVMCDRVYPKYMAIEDLEWAKENKIDKLNTFRCAYAKTCNIPWTEAGCN